MVQYDQNMFVCAFPFCEANMCNPFQTFQYLSDQSKILNYLQKQSTFIYLIEKL